MMDAEDLEMFERSIRHAAESAADGVALDVALTDLGWHEALGDFPREAVSALFSIQGEVNATSSALHRVVAWGLTGSTAAAGAVLPSLGSSEPPGLPSGDSIDIGIDGLANAALVAGGLIIVPVVPSDADVTHITIDAGELDLSPVTGLDVGAQLVRIGGSLPASDPATATATAGGSWTEALRLGRLAVGHELVGASRGVLAQAREHALERIQFGQPIARFQAVRHKLAEVLIAIETAEALLDAAWLDGTEVTASMAKAAAGRAGRLAAKNGQQVLAGIGFTEEHGVHRWIRRILLLDELLGSSRTLTKELGEQLLESRQLPPLLPL